MKTSTKLMLTVVVIASFGLVGVAKWVDAAPSQSPVAVMKERAAQAMEKSNGDGETNDDAKEQQESKDLQPLAKISAQQAQQAAETAEKGKATRIKLENEDGNLIYAIVIGQKEVKVDAGNGQVLYSEAMSGDLNDQTADRKRPRSSVQVPQSASDGDGETNDDR